MSFNENLKEAMFCKNITTIQLAKITGINSGTISNYLKTKGSMPPADKALKLAKALDVSVDFLINGFDSNTSSSIKQKSSFPVAVLKIAQDISNLENDELSAIKNVVNVMKSHKDK